MFNECCLFWVLLVMLLNKIFFVLKGVKIRMIEFEKLRIVKIDEEKDYGKFIVEFFERGYGIILGNFLCCILLFFLLGVVIINI